MEIKGSGQGVAVEIFGCLIHLDAVLTAIAKRNLRNKDHYKAQNPRPVIPSEKVLLNYNEEAARHEYKHMEVAARLKDGDAEIAQPLSREEAVAEAKRCMSCGLCVECGECWNFCQDQAIIKPLKAGEKYQFKMELCNGCKKCEEQCPCGFIEMHMPGEAPVYDEA